MSVEEAVSKYNGDVFLYYGNISRYGYSLLSDALENRVDKKEKICLILVTYGGDPDAGYRIARALSHHYKKVEILIPDACKSAGTLLCIGANKLILGDRGELGPLDIQLSKPDEMFENMSGLDILQALNALEVQVRKSFRNSLVDIRGGLRLKTKIAADIATKLTDGWIAPIAAKIDPVTLGEHQRAMQIAYEYGERLNNASKSLCEDALAKLIGNYPSHGFVIDRKEAKELFNNVSSPNDETYGLYSWAREIVKNKDINNLIVLDVGCQLDNESKKNEHINTEESKDKSEASDTSDETNSGESEQESASDESDDAQPNKE